MLIQANTVGIQATAEVLEVLPVEWRPSDLGERQGTRIHLVLSLGIGVHIFRPVVALHTQDVLAQAQGLQGIRHRIVTIGFREINR